MGIRTWFWKLGIGLRLDNKLTKQNNLILPAEVCDVQGEMSSVSIYPQYYGERNLVLDTICDNIPKDDQENVSFHISRFSHRELDDPKDPILWQVMEILLPWAAHDTLPIMNNPEQHPSGSIHRHSSRHLQPRVTSSVVDWPPSPFFSNNLDFA